MEGNQDKRNRSSRSVGSACSHYARSMPGSSLGGAPRSVVGAREEPALSGSLALRPEPAGPSRQMFVISPERPGRRVGFTALASVYRALSSPTDAAKLGSVTPSTAEAQNADAITAAEAGRATAAVVRRARPQSSKGTTGQLSKQAASSIS